MNCIHHDKVRPGGAIFEDDEELELPGEAGIKAKYAKEVRVKHEANLEKCRSAAESETAVTIIRNRRSRNRRYTVTYTWIAPPEFHIDFTCFKQCDLIRISPITAVG